MNYKIFQVKQEKVREYGFICFDKAEKLNVVNSDNYNVVYEGIIDKNDEKYFSDNPQMLAEKIFIKFNINRPDDFKGHSLSVSDVVQIGNDYFYCDSFCFEKIKTCNL